MSFLLKGLSRGLVSDEKQPVEGISGVDANSLDGQEVEHDTDESVQPGELTLEEDTAGGMGRHLGLFSTTLLMYAGNSSI